MGSTVRPSNSSISKTRNSTVLFVKLTFRYAVHLLAIMKVSQFPLLSAVSTENAPCTCEREFFSESRTDFKLVTSQRPAIEGL